MGALLAGAAIALAILFGRQSSELVVLVPAADGHIGTVVIERDGKQTVLNTAYATSRVGALQPDDAVAVAATTITTEQDVRREFGAALDAIPAPPVSFLLYF